MTAQCDPTLAALLRAARDPVEALADDQSLATFARLTEVAPAAPGGKGRLVRLACGHFTVTRGRLRARCPRCGEMIRTGYDHDGFRRLGHPDTFSWPADPLRALNEPDDSHFRDMINRASVI